MILEFLYQKKLMVKNIIYLVKLPEKNDIPKSERYKERLSYFFDIFKIDITVVKHFELDDKGNKLEDSC
jgi:hypothetical protein